MDDTYLGNSERASLYQFVRRHDAELPVEIDERDAFESWLESVKTARILLAWTEDASVAELVSEYRIGPGDLESRIERAQWLLGAAGALAEVIGVTVPEIDRVRGRL
jgi:helicase